MSAEIPGSGTIQSPEWPGPSPSPSQDEWPDRGRHELPLPEGDLESRVSAAIRAGREFLFSIQRGESHWCAELESNATITAEYVLMCQMLGLREELAERGAGISRYLFSRQREDGSWSIAHGCDGDVSTTAEVYLALRILNAAAGTAEGSPREKSGMARAESFIRSKGGLERARIFTRIFLAMFGLCPWDAIPVIPPETIFLPPASAVNIYRLSSWARGTMVPLFIIAHHRPLFALPNGKSRENGWLDHLWLNPARKGVPCSEPLPEVARKHGASWKTLFGAIDLALRLYEKAPLQPLRGLALKRCTQWVLEHQEESGDWAGIFPPMLNGVIALTLQGYSLDSGPVKRGLEAIRRFSWEEEGSFRIQACVSPIWDTALAVIGLIDSKTEPSDPRLAKAMEWVLERQLLDKRGDWRVYRPELAPGGWSFEYHNSWYPDIDDTAAVLLALLKQNPSGASEPAARRIERRIGRGMEWLLGMQNRDGGWAAFDVDNDKAFLNHIPFSDMDSLCDPSTPDVTGRVIEALGLYLERSVNRGEKPSKLTRRIREACRRGIGYLRESQEAEGAWFGRWGVNYVYGTSNVLCGLSRIETRDQMTSRALDWLKSAQNADGGWGEGLDSYRDRSRMGRGESCASQTAWALMGLLAHLPPSDPAIRRGVHWLVSRQTAAKPTQAREGGVALPLARGASWEEEQFTGTGFPNHFYLRYHLYRHYFPMMALGRFAAALEN